MVRKKTRFLPFNIEEAFKGETTKKIKLLFEIDDSKAEKLKSEIELTTEKITSHTPAKLNNDFFTKLLGKDKASNLDEFKEGVKSLMVAQSKSESNVFFGRNMTEILKQNIEVPPFNNNFLSKVINEKKKTAESKINEKEEIEKLIKHLKWETISKQIFKEAKLKLEETDIDAATTSLAKAQLWSMGLNTDEFVDMVKQQMLHGKKADDKMHQEIHKEAFFMKLSGYVKGKAKVNTTKVSIEELREKFKRFDTPAVEATTVEVT